MNLILLVIAALIGVAIWLIEGMPSKLKTALTVAAVVLVIAWVLAFLGFDLQGILKS